MEMGLHTDLERAHTRINDILGKERTECFETAVVVEELRQRWRPERPRVVLLAESHVWTSRGEANSRVHQPDGAETGFARFVYSLGGGESHIVAPAVKPNVGAFQYWRLFHDSVRGPSNSYHSLLKSKKSGEPDLNRRLANKLQLLHELHNAGVWLVDASISALVRRGQRLAEGATYESVLRDCWEYYVGTIVCAASPDTVIIIGKSVAKTIGETVRRDLPKTNLEVIKQPEGVRKRAELMEYRQRVFDLCSAASCAIGTPKTGTYGLGESDPVPGGPSQS